MKAYDRLFIGGEWVSPAGTGTIDVINPTTEEIVGRVPDATEAEVMAAVVAAMLTVFIKTEESEDVAPALPNFTGQNSGSGSSNSGMTNDDD